MTNKKDQALKHLEHELPERVMKALRKVAEKYKSKGIRLFIFGSFAKESNRSNSDLDIGIEWRKEHSHHIYRNIREDIWNLPTIRKIDLVDMSKASPDFRDESKNERIYL